jgi:intraflagellar transport protein 81
MCLKIPIFWESNIPFILICCTFEGRVSFQKMNQQIDLKPVQEVISKAPFLKKYSIIQLHDELSPPLLMGLVFEVAAYIDEANKNSVFLKEIQPEEKVAHLVDFLRMLKYKDANNFDTCFNEFLTLRREAILNSLAFMAKDVELYKKRAYLAQFLSIPDVPTDFIHDDGIANLLKEIGEIQEEFKVTHKYLDGLNQSGPNAGSLKREIQLMEEEKQQILSKIGRIQKRVQSIPKSVQWLQAAQDLRAEQQKAQDLEVRLKDQKLQIQQVERKLQSTSQSLKVIQNGMVTATPDSVFSKMEEENRMNRFLAKENLPKQLKELEEKLKGLNSIAESNAISEEELKKMETEILALNEQNAQLSEQKLKTK